MNVTISHIPDDLYAKDEYSPRLRLRCIRAATISAMLSFPCQAIEIFDPETGQVYSTQMSVSFPEYGIQEPAGGAQWASGSYTTSGLRLPWIDLPAATPITSIQLRARIEPGVWEITCSGKTRTSPLASHPQTASLNVQLKTERGSNPVNVTLPSNGGVVSLPSPTPTANQIYAGISSIRFEPTKITSFPGINLCAWDGSGKIMSAGTITVEVNAPPSIGWEPVSLISYSVKGGVLSYRPADIVVLPSQIEQTLTISENIQPITTSVRIESWGITPIDRIRLEVRKLTGDLDLFAQDARGTYRAITATGNDSLTHPDGTLVLGVRNKFPGVKTATVLIVGSYL